MYSDFVFGGSGEQRKFGSIPSPIEYIGVLYGEARVWVGDVCSGHVTSNQIVVGFFSHYQIVRRVVCEGCRVGKDDTPCPIVRIEGYWVGFGVTP